MPRAKAVSQQRRAPVGGSGFPAPTRRTPQDHDDRIAGIFSTIHPARR
ncbi:hypothetical protein M3654_24445 [Bacillus licheniformis]|nr:hypothetical protein [Bacillus licheniformis]